MSGVDRISLLPDAILLHILSFLPSKTVVQATTTLSRRWRNLCPNFHLKCQISPLDLSPSYYSPIKFPASILTCSSLVLLKLINVTVDRASTVHLPLLKTLYMDEVEFAKDEYLEMILSGCHNIHHLQIKGLDLLPSFIPLAVTFTNLIHMEISVNQCNWLWIVGLLNSCPLLQVLDVGLDKLGLADQPYPQPVPGCLSSHLRACTLRNFDGDDVSFQFATYILLNASVLNKMTIHCRSSIEEGEMLEIGRKINKARRGSRTCAVWF